MLDQSQSVEPLDLLTPANSPQLRSRLMEGFAEVIMRKVCFDILKNLRCKVRILNCVNSVVNQEAALSSLPNLMLAGVVEMKPAPGSMVVCVGGDLVGALVDEICGSTSSNMYVRNELSNMETRFGKKLIEITANAIAEVFSNVMPITRAVTHYESASGMLSIADAQTWMVSTTGSLKTQLGFGSITVLGTHSGLEPLEMRMITRVGPDGTETDAHWLGMLGRISEYTPIDIRVEVARARLPLHAVETMHIGQLLPIWLLQNAIILAGGTEAFEADYGQVDGNACFRVKDRVQRESTRLVTPLANLSIDGGKVGRVAVHAMQASGTGKNVLESVTLAISVELGRTQILLKDLRELKPGQVIILDQLSDDPLKIYVNGRFFGTGEVVAVGKKKYSIRVTSLEHILEFPVAG